MNRAFLIGLTVYLAIAMPVVWFTDATFNGQGDLQLFRLALYVPIVFSSGITSALALLAIAREHWRLRTTKGLVSWPPEWDYSVAGWATTKFLFFLGLFLYGSGLWPHPWVLTAPLVLFFIGHAMFTAQWLGPDGMERGRPRTTQEDMAP